MRIAVDATPLIAKPTGVGTFAAGLIGSLCEFENTALAPSKITGTYGSIEVVEYALNSPQRYRAWLAAWRGRASRSGQTSASDKSARSTGGALRQQQQALRQQQQALRQQRQALRQQRIALDGSKRHMMWLPPSAAPWVWHYLKIPVERTLGPLDVVHGTSFMVPPAKSALRVVTVHDLTYLMRDEVPRRVTWWDHYVRQAINTGAVVHTQSHYVAEEVAQHYGAERVGVVRPAIELRNPAEVAAAKQNANGVPYILALGFSQPRKRLPLLVSAFEQVYQKLSAQGRDCQLQLVGPAGLDEAALLERISHLPSHIQSRVIRRGWVPAAERDALLAAAAVLAFPSIYEGFGYPALEAMALQVPVVAAAAGSLPEAVGDAALLVPPDDAEALAATLERVLSEPDLQADLVQRGLVHVAAHSPRQAATEMLALYGAHM